MMGMRMMRTVIMLYLLSLIVIYPVLAGEEEEEPENINEKIEKFFSDKGSAETAQKSAAESSFIINRSDCSSCHDRYKGTQRPGANFEKCGNCHGAHGSERVPETGAGVPHSLHIGIQKINPSCSGCHKVPACSDCHNSHIDRSIDNNLTNIATKCESCHGRLSSVAGHGDLRSALQSGKHNWMRSCDLCHFSDRVNLSFSNLYTANLKNKNDTTKFCSICHSAQLERMNRGEHGDSNGNCAQCHNPHSTGLTGTASGLNPGKEISDFNLSNVIITFDSLQRSIQEIPVFQNIWVFYILALIVAGSVAEHVLTKHEKGEVIMADNIRIVHDIKHSKVLEIEMNHISIVDKILNIIEFKDINVLGITIKNIPNSINRKAVIFLDFSKVEPIGESREELLKTIGESDGIISAKYSDRYEV